MKKLGSYVLSTPYQKWANDVRNSFALDSFVITVLTLLRTYLKWLIALAEALPNVTVS